MQNRIKCPSCAVEIDVKEAVSVEIKQGIEKEQRELKKAFEEEVEKKREEYKVAFETMKKEKEILEQKEKDFEARLKKELADSLNKEREQLKKELRAEVASENTTAMESLKEQLQEKTKQINELNNIKMQLEIAKQENMLLESKIKAEAQQQINNELLKQKEQMQKQFEEQNELKLKEKDVQLESMKAQIKELQRKAEQGSQQLQGEVQELAIEEYLKENFPFDNITEIKKGANGGDCIQIVHTREIQNCGKIYYESKRTKEFNKNWIEKFKGDMRELGADVGVLVTEVLPKELQRMGIFQGIFICTFLEFKALAGILREGVISVHLAKSSQENRQDKMQLLYQYLTSAEFKMQIEAIVEGFTQMQSDLDSEKRAMQRIWKQREKQIEKVLISTTNMYGAMKGIAGNAIGEIKALELTPLALES